VFLEVEVEVVATPAAVEVVGVEGGAAADAVVPGSGGEITTVSVATTTVFTLSDEVDDGGGLPASPVPCAAIGKIPLFTKGLIRSLS